MCISVFDPSFQICKFKSFYWKYQKIVRYSCDESFFRTIVKSQTLCGSRTGGLSANRLVLYVFQKTKPTPVHHGSRLCYNCQSSILHCHSVTRSSHFTMPNITPMEMRQTARKTAQHIHSGQALYITGPNQMSRLPTAVAPSHRP